MYTFLIYEMRNLIINKIAGCKPETATVLRYTWISKDSGEIHDIIEFELVSQGKKKKAPSILQAIISAEKVKKEMHHDYDPNLELVRSINTILFNQTTQIWDTIIAIELPE